MSQLSRSRHSRKKWLSTTFLLSSPRVPSLILHGPNSALMTVNVQVTNFAIHSRAVQAGPELESDATVQANVLEVPFASGANVRVDLIVNVLLVKLAPQTVAVSIANAPLHMNALMVKFAATTDALAVLTMVSVLEVCIASAKGAKSLVHASFNLTVQGSKDAFSASADIQVEEASVTMTSIVSVISGAIATIDAPVSQVKLQAVVDPVPVRTFFGES